MKDDSNEFVARDLDTGMELDFDPLRDDPKLEQRVRSGEFTREEADALLEAAARRQIAEHGPDLDTDEEGLITEGGFGTGQGMAWHSKKDGKVS